MFLSGGLDSSAIAALMAGMIDRPLQTFSVAFKDRAFSELDYARQVSSAIKADAHEVVIDENDFFGALPRLIWHEDEPLAHPSSVPLYFVSELARQHVKVVLTGEGSDELLAGYAKYPKALVNWRAAAAYGVLPHPLRSWIADTVVPRLPASMRRYASRSFMSMERTPEAMFFDNFAAIRLARQHDLLTSRFADSSPEQVYGPSRQYFDAPNGRSTVLDRLLYADLKTYLVELLMKQDQMSMAASIESRVRSSITSWSSSRPRCRPGSSCADSPPSGFCARRCGRSSRPKSSRGPRWDSGALRMWMRGQWSGVARDVLLDSRSRQRGIVEPAAVER